MPDSREERDGLCGGVAHVASMPESKVRRWSLEPANWKPLELRIGSRCAEFMWMWRENGLEHYKHIDTRRYLILDAKGRSYVRRDGETVRVDFRKEFRRVVEAIDA